MPSGTEHGSDTYVHTLYLKGRIWQTGLPGLFKGREAVSNHLPKMTKRASKG